VRVLIAIALVANAVLFLSALITAVPVPAANVVVIAEPSVAVPQSPWVARISAVAVGGKGQSGVAGSVKHGKLENGIVTFPVAAPGPQTVHMSLGVTGASHTLAECDITVTANPAAPSALLEPLAAPRTQIIGARTLAVTLAPDVVKAGAPLTATVSAPSPQRLAVELLVDGVLRGAKYVDVADAPRPVAVEVPADAKDGSLVVVHVGEPWPQARGVWAAARVGQRAPADLGAEQPARLRPPALESCRVLKGKTPAEGLRAAFEGVSGVIVVFVAFGAFAAARKDVKRGAVLAVLAALAVAAIFAGLDVVLRMFAAG
jgi:hypothetical protein